MSHLAPSAQEIEERLKAALPLDFISVRDDSAKHHGHAGAVAGGGHFHVTLVSSGKQEGYRDWETVRKIVV